MKQILNQLYNYEPLSSDQSYSILEQISSNSFNPSQISAFITSYLMRDITVEELAGFRQALLDLKVPFHTDYRTIDLCGTGGDGKNTFNISTLSSFVVAGAGVRVTKHGNYGVSSFCGSSNILQSLGLEFTSNSSILNKQIEEANICFLHAPLFHPAMKSVAPIRKELGVKTFFNLLGPLVNPAEPEHQLIGVFSLKVLRLYQLMHQSIDKNVSIVHAIDGYDEVSLTSPFKLVSKNLEALHTPESLGFEKLKQSEIEGGNSIEDAKTIFLNVLKNKSTEAQKNVVCANAGLAISNYNSISIADGILAARESIDNGNALKSLKTLIS
jgi:anthranilate phosphoribosyltransferase